MIRHITALQKQSVSIVLIRVLGTGLSVFVTVLIARLLGPEALGVYSYATVIIVIFGVPVTRGWATLLLRATARHGKLDVETATMKRDGIVISVVFSLFLLLIALLVLEWAEESRLLDSLRPHEVLIILLLATTLFFDQVSALRMSVLRAIDMPVLGQLPEMLVRPALIGAGLIVFWVSFGKSLDMRHLFMTLAIGASLSALFGQYVLSMVQGSRAPVARASGLNPEWIRSAAMLAGSALLVQINGYVDILLLGAFVSADQIGIYRVAIQIAALANFGYVALNMLAAQRFSRLAGEGSQTGVLHSSRWLSRAALFAAVPLPIFLFLAGERFFIFLFGVDFGPANQPAIYIALGFVFSAAIGMARTLLVMRHHELLVMRTTIAALALNILLCLILIPLFGINGAAIANMSSAILWNTLLWWLAWRRTGIDTSVLG